MSNQTWAMSKMLSELMARHGVMLGSPEAVPLSEPTSTPTFVPAIPDWANDQHTLAGRKLGRGLDHFRQEGAKLVPPPTADDPYEDEAYRLWALKQQGR